MSQNIVTTNKAPQNPILDLKVSLYNSRVSFTTHMCPKVLSLLHVGVFTQRQGLFSHCPQSFNKKRSTMYQNRQKCLIPFFTSLKSIELASLASNVQEMRLFE